MRVSAAKKPKVRISYDEMEAYLRLPMPAFDEDYTLSEVLELLKINGVKYGIDEKKVSEILEKKYYDVELLVAKGDAVADGVDAYFDFYFDTELNKKPTRREDGSVDYWSIHSIEMVKEGQMIAAYHEPISGSNGMNVKGKVIVAKKGRPLPPLTGKGFERSSDNMQYFSQMDGKIEMRNNRIVISSVHEIQGDVGFKTGNIDFRGDVLIHGNVPTGAIVKATGSITIDGNVEGALIEAGKDVIIRGGVLGSEKGTIKSKANVNAKFLEYVTIRAEGSIHTDSAINCNIKTNDKLYLEGKHARLIGGVVYATMGVEASNIGNHYGVKTEVYVGVNKELKKEINYHENCVKEAQDMLDKIAVGLKQLEQFQKEGKDVDPQGVNKASLLRTKIVKQADIAAHTQQLNKISETVDNSQDAHIDAFYKVYQGTVVGINDAVHNVEEEQESVCFVEKEGNILMFSLKDQMA